MTTMATLALDHECVLAHRAIVHDLARPARKAVACRLLGLGLQNARARAMIDEIIHRHGGDGLG